MGLRRGGCNLTSVSKICLALREIELEQRAGWEAGEATGISLESESGAQSCPTLLQHGLYSP